jgi:hypothetical protein
MDAVVEYQGTRWIDARLPWEAEPWPAPRPSRDPLLRGYDISAKELRAYGRTKPWVWPGRAVYFLCDQHADADALLASLVASGGIAKLGPGDHEIEPTAEGRGAAFVIGGDCVDKGPANLRLLRVVRGLVDTGVDVRLLAGNHDLRTLVGLSYLGRKEAHLAHLFVRMGQKTIPLLREIWQEYLAGAANGPSEPREAELRELLFPDEGWYTAFPRAMAGRMNPVKLDKEVRRIREKVAEFEARCRRLGMTLRMVYAAARRARRLFLEPEGELAWFYDGMQLAARFGSFLFIHAGLDDTAADVLERRGVDGLNRWFADARADDLFELYHGPVGNTFRTKYRDIDLPLTADGVAAAHRAGVYAIVHGHRNILRGQRMVLRSGILNFECDCSVDLNTRHIEDLRGKGAAATVFRPDGRILGISSDHPRAKLFDPARACGFATIV